MEVLASYDKVGLGLNLSDVSEVSDDNITSEIAIAKDVDCINDHW
jgi:hypothetical protein